MKPKIIEPVIISIFANSTTLNDIFNAIKLICCNLKTHLDNLNLNNIAKFVHSEAKPILHHVDEILSVRRIDQRREATVGHVGCILRATVTERRQL